MVTKTPNLQLTQPATNSIGWSRSVNGNFAIIDAALSQFFVQANFVGIWENGGVYAIDDTVVDSTNSNIYTCLVGHTAALSPTTFAQDRAANPSYWENSTIVGARGRGAWVTATEYLKGDFVVSGTVYAVATANHTSGATFGGDAAYWEELIDVSSAVVPDGTVTGAKFADPLAIPYATTFAVGFTVTTGGITVTAGATSLQGTTIQSGGLVVTAGGITVTAGGIGVTAGGITITAGGLTVVAGGATIAGNVALTNGLTVGVGLTVTTGGITVVANGITVTGNSTITGTLGGLTGLTVASGGANVTGAVGITGAVTITGATGITGDITHVGALTTQIVTVTGSAAPVNGIALPTTNTIALYTNSVERFRFGALGGIGIAGANYGAAGEALLSGGSGAAATWGTPSSSTVSIASGSLTGTAVVITDIPATYRYLILNIVAASHNAGGSRSMLVRASTNNGVSYDSTTGNYIGLSSHPLSSVDDMAAASLIECTAIGAAETFTGMVMLFGYHGNSYAPVQSVVDVSSGDTIAVNGFYKNGASAINALQMLLSGSGDFDAGTYALYGVK